MPLTPADIHNVAFKKPPIGKRGYGEEEVDAFLDEAEQEMIRLLEENNALRNQLQRGGGGGGVDTTMVLNDELAGLAGQLERMQDARDRAEHNARDLQGRLEQARSAVQARPAPAPAPDGEERDVRVLMMAQRTADEYMRDAERESNKVITTAQQKAEKLLGEARTRADAIEGDAHRNHTESMDNLATGRAALLDERRCGSSSPGRCGTWTAPRTTDAARQDPPAARLLRRAGQTTCIRAHRPRSSAPPAARRDRSSSARVVSWATAEVCRCCGARRSAISRYRIASRSRPRSRASARAVSA
jgi:DivIVA domain-containing protein